MAEQSRRRLPPHRLDNASAPVSALSDVACVAEPLHEHVPRTADALHSPAGLGRSRREAVARQRRNHDVEGVLRPAAIRGRIGERTDGLDLLEDRPGPSVRDDQRQRVRVAGAHVDEVDVHPVDGGLELREGVQFRLALAPVIIRRPMADEFLELRELRALRLIGDRLLVGPPGRREAPAKIDELLLRDLNFEGPDVIRRFAANAEFVGSKLAAPATAIPIALAGQKTATIDVDGFKRMES